MNTRPGTPLVFVLCIGLAWVWMGTVAAAELSVAAATNMAGLQRMLTQRIGKAYCQVGLGIEPQNSREQLFEAVELFDTQLAELQAFAPNSQVRNALAQVKQLWVPYKVAATGPVTKDGARQVAYWSDDLLHASHKVVQLLQDTSNTPYARLVNVSGRQRMLSQRLAKLYMLQVWGFDTLTIRDEIESAVNEFTGALAVLQGAPENTNDIRRQLMIVARDWTWLRKALNMAGTDPFPETLAGVSESVLLNMDRITKLYEELAEKGQRPPAVRRKSTSGSKTDTTR
ncbi:MAG: type IV pili methyl-accepting chemotaxis transducer N-terminal domain-containing protein [Gammaproteobacteria bacterium]